MASLFSTALGCAASGSDDRAHGPVFDPHDAGSSDATGEGAPPKPVGDAAVDVPAFDSALPEAAPADAPHDSADSTSACTDKTALVAGNGTTLYGALKTGDGAWATSSTSSAVLSAPALVATGGGFHAVIRASGNALKWTATAGASWSALAQIGQATTRDTPSLATLGAAVHLVYQGNDFKYYHGTFSGGAWDAASDPVGGASAQSFGPSAPSTAGVGAELLVAHRGGNASVELYDEIYASGGWQPGHLQTGVQLETIPTTTMAMNGGTSDAMIAFLRLGDFKISYVTRVASAWSSAKILDTTAYANDRLGLAPLPGGRAVLVYRGSDGKPYFSVYDATAVPEWTLPAPLVAGTNPQIAGVPAIAPGACGDEAVAALAIAGGDVLVTRFVGGVWTSPAAITGTGSSTSLAIATSK